MLRKLIAFSINNAAIILFMSVVFLFLTVTQVMDMPVDVFPELNAPTVVILSEAGGLAADEVEQYVTFPLENAVNGLPGVRRVRSSSAMGLSLVWVEFSWGEDIYRSRQVVAEGVATVLEQLPENVHTEMAPITGITGEIMLLALSSPDGSVSPLELRAFAEFNLRRRLLGVSGVAQVVALGGELPEYQINVREDRLRLYGLSIQDVVNAASESHSIASAGYLPNVRGREISLRQVARVRQVEDIRETIIKYHNGVPVTIGEVADVQLGPTPSRGTGSSAGDPAVVVSIKKAPFTNTLEITKQIDATLDDVEAGLPEGMALNRHVMRQADFINLSLHNVWKVIRDAAIFVCIVLILFLMNVRTTVITLTAIPLSMAMALLVLKGMNQSINVMTLGGLAIAIGELVDDAIIDVENIYRRLRENQALPESEQRNKLNVIFEASNEIRSSIVFATAIIILVFVPLLFLQGIEGRFFRPMGIAYIVSIAASLLVALTVTPALCRYLLAGKLKEEKDSWVSRKLKGAYRPSLGWVLRHRLLVWSCAAAASVGSLMLGATFGSNFLPDFNEGVFTVFVDAPPDTSLEESNRMVTGLDKQLAAIEGVNSVVRRTGRAERDEHAHGVNRSEINVTIKEGYAKEEILREIDQVLESMPGLTTEVGSPIGHQLSHVLSGTLAQLAINVNGDDLPTLRTIAKRIEVALEDVPGVRDVLANREAMVESLPIRYRHEDLKRWGLSPAAAAEQVEAAFNGRVVETVNDGVRLYDIVVRLHPDQREKYEDVKSLLLRGRDGALVRLEEVASIGPELTPLGIQRTNGQRTAIISMNVAEGHNLGDVVAAVQTAVDPIVAEYGFSATYGGQFEAQQSASRTIYLMSAFVCIVIVIMLSMVFRSTLAALLVMVNLPLALIGGIIAIFITESPGVISNFGGLFGLGSYTAPVISIASMVGFVTLFGIAVRNGILLVNHYAHLLEEGVAFQEAVLRGSEERLIPILMTALTAVLGLMPLALAMGEPGSELLSPLAVVVLGGLCSSTLLNLYIVPAGYHWLFQKRSIINKDRETVTL